MVSTGGCVWELFEFVFAGGAEVIVGYGVEFSFIFGSGGHKAVDIGAVIEAEGVSGFV